MQLNLFEPASTNETPQAVEHEIEALLCTQMDLMTNGEPDPTDATARPGPETPGMKSGGFRSLADILPALSDANCDLKGAAQLRSAVRGVARVLNLPLGQIPADASQLRPMLEAARPASAGVKPRNWIQMKSGLRRALRFCGEDIMAGRDPSELGADWRALLDDAPERRFAIGLSRVLRYLSGQGVRPADVTRDHLEQFGHALTSRSLHPRPVQAYREAMKLWNRAAREIAGWPQVFVTLERNPRLYSLEWEEFPSSLLAEFEAFHAEKREPDWLAEDFAPPVREITVANRRRLLRQIASSLVLSGFPIEKMTSLAVLTDPVNAKAALRHVMARNGNRPTPNTEHQARLLLTIARHWVRDPEQARALQGIVANLHIPRLGMTQKNKDRLRQLDVPENVDLLLALPARIYRAAQTNEPEGPHAARLMYALAVQILIFAPIRVGNLYRLEIGKEIREVRHGRQRQRYLVLDASDTKTKRTYEAPLPVEINWMLDAWLAQHRGKIFNGRTTLLFPNPRGELRSSNAFSAKLSKFIARETGLDINTHLFRHIAGKLYLEQDDRGIETVRQLLGHTNTRTTLRNYAHLDADRAVRRHANVILARMDESKFKASPEAKL